MFKYFVIYKPYGVISQFSTHDPVKQPALGSLYHFPKDVYPVGRLDSDSEGLLVITNDKTLNDLLLNPRNKKAKTYLVQVDGDITEKAIQVLQNGVNITIEGKPYRTWPANVTKITEPENLPPRNPPIRVRKTIPASWIQLTITEGKNRQVRKMTAAVGFPALRLIRWSMEKLNLEGMHPGEVKEYTRDQLKNLLQLDTL